MKIASPAVWILVGLFLSLAAVAAKAQIVPDNTLPENSRVEAGCTNCTIEGGTTRGSNLFHSFREFSIPTGGSASFNNAPQIENILTRVTGNSVSNIDGLLRSNGTANLFLLNPNGVIFGANARLDVGGAFVTSTADAIGFPNGDLFSATNPTAPTPLLNVNPNALLFNQLNPQPIISQGAILQVPNGQTLNLVGGNVAIEGGQLLAPGGRVELAGVAATGEVGLTQQGSEWRSSVPDGLARADVSIGNGAIVNVRSGSGGSIAITARNLQGTGLGTQVGAGIAAGLGTVDAQAGDVDINATEAINLDEMLIFNQVAEDGIGNAGNLNITTGTLSLTNGAQVAASTFGQGNAGNVTITASDAVSFDGVSSNGFSSAAGSTVERGGIGQGGICQIDCVNDKSLWEIALQTQWQSD